MVLDMARDLNEFTSDEKLAAEMGVSGTTVRNWRHGRATPSIERMMQLKKLSNLPLDHFLIIERSGASNAA